MENILVLAGFKTTPRKHMEIYRLVMYLDGNWILFNGGSPLRMDNLEKKMSKF